MRPSARALLLAALIAAPLAATAEDGPGEWRLRPLYSLRCGTPLGPSGVLGLALTLGEHRGPGTWNGPHVVGELGVGGWKVGVGPAKGAEDIIMGGLRLAVLRTFGHPFAGLPDRTYTGLEAGGSIERFNVTAGLFIAARPGQNASVLGTVSIGLGNAP